MTAWTRAPEAVFAGFAPAAAVGPASALLTEEDRQAAAGLPPLRRAEFSRGRTLLRWTLRWACPGPAAGRPVRATGRGRPVLDTDPLIGVSVSHCADLLAAAVAPGRDVGIDVEQPIPPTPGLLRRLCPPPACTGQPGAASQPLRLAQLWTVHEACAKATGTGLGREFPRIEVGEGQSAGTHDGLEWLLLPCIYGAAAALALGSGQTRPSTVRLAFPGTDSLAPGRPEPSCFDLRTPNPAAPFPPGGRP